MCFLFLFIFWLHWAFSSCSKWELLFCCVAWASHHSGFSCCEAPGTWTSLVAARRLKSVGSVFGAHWLRYSMMCGIFLDPGSKPCSCISRQIPIHQGSPSCVLFKIILTICMLSKVISDCFWNVMEYKLSQCDLSHTLVSAIT